MWVVLDSGKRSAALGIHGPEASEFAGRVDHHHAVVAGVRKQLGGGKRGAALGIHGVSTNAATFARVLCSFEYKLQIFIF